MIGTGLKKLANENGMKVANGLAYGTFRGYSAAFWDGSGTKTMMLSTSIRDVDAKSEFFSRLGQVNYQKEYRVRELTTMDDGIVVVFNDTVGTLKKMDEFFNFFFPILDACGATKADVCSCCGQPFDGTESWLLVNDAPVKLHRACRDCADSRHCPRAVGWRAGAYQGQGQREYHQERDVCGDTRNELYWNKLCSCFGCCVRGGGPPAPGCG